MKTETMKSNSLKAKKPLKQKSPLKVKVGLSTTSTLKSQSGVKKAKPSVSKLKKEADAWHSKATRYRFAEKVGGEWLAECITCPPGNPRPIKNLQCGHFMSRQYNVLRYDELNTAPQCYGDNVMQQGKQYEFGLQIDRLYGDGTAKRLHKQSKTPHQFKPEELLEIIEDRKEQVRWYESQ